MAKDNTDLASAVVRGDDLANHAEALLGGGYGDDLSELIVDAIADLLHFLRSEVGPEAHHHAAQSAVMHVDAEIEVHDLSEAFDASPYSGDRTAQ